MLFLTILISLNVSKNQNLTKHVYTKTVYRSDYSEYLPQENHPLAEPRFPISDPRKPFVCQHCGVGFAREKALASHARVHGGDSPFECQKCGEMFWDANLMREHVKNKHGGTCLLRTFL